MAELHRCKVTWAYCDGDCDKCTASATTQISMAYVTPTTADVVEVVRCKDCKYFVLDWLEKIENISLITGHEICQKWGEGCKTSPYGYCFLGERRKEDCNANKSTD